MQPYNGGIGAQDSLWLIHDLDRIDKHRFVRVLPATTMGSHHVAHPDAREKFRPLGPLEDGAELVRFVFPNPQPEVDMQFRPMFSMSLGDRPFARSATLDMEHMVTCLRDTILPRFERFF